MVLAGIGAGLAVIGAGIGIGKIGGSAELSAKEDGSGATAARISRDVSAGGAGI